MASWSPSAILRNKAWSVPVFRSAGTLPVRSAIEASRPASEFASESASEFGLSMIASPDLIQPVNAARAAMFQYLFEDSAGGEAARVRAHRIYLEAARGLYDGIGSSKFG